MTGCRDCLCLLLPCLLAVSGCHSPGPNHAEPLRLRVLTYNIKHCRGMDGAFDYQRLADIIKRANPDLVALQEVDVKTRRASGVDQPAKLGQLTGLTPFFAEAIPYQGGSYGEALLSRFPIKGFYRQQLAAEPGQEKRAAAVISVEPWDTVNMRVVFAGTHLCHESSKTRLKQVKQINSNRAYQGSATILTGDFNFTPDSEPYQAMIRAGWVDTAASFGDPQPTIPADNPTKRIDDVFVAPAHRWRIIDVKVLDEPIASDHAPLLVELEYVSAQP